MQIKNIDAYLFFINNLSSDLKFDQILKIFEPSRQTNRTGWIPVKSLMATSENSQTYNIDIRYAWSPIIFSQNLVDFCWDIESILDKKQIKNQEKRLIIYLCEKSTGLKQNQKADQVENRFLFGDYWSSIEHLYFLLPIEHPFCINYQSYQDDNLDYYSKILLDPIIDCEICDFQTDGQSKWFLPNLPERKGEGGLRTQGIFKSYSGELPFISIVTVVLNGEKYLEQSIQSVISQNHKNLEYILVDGGSQDGTLSIIKRYENFIDYWVSEPDRGIYHAMNKGWSISRGDYIYYLGSDDILVNLPQTALQKAKQQDIKLVYGSVIMGNSQLFNSHYGIMLILRNTLHHQGLFLKNDLQNPPFNERYKFYADFDLNQNLYKQRVKAIKSRSIIALFREDGSSSKRGDRERTKILKKEAKQIIFSNFGLLGLILSYVIGKPIALFLKLSKNLPSLKR